MAERDRRQRATQERFSNEWGTGGPNQYVVVSGHFDSFNAGSGATDNGTGSLTAIEVMCILETAYPNPKRTIVIGLSHSEEQGAQRLNGVR